MNVDCGVLEHLIKDVGDSERGKGISKVAAIFHLANYYNNTNREIFTFNPSRVETKCRYLRFLNLV